MEIISSNDPQVMHVVEGFETTVDGVASVDFGPASKIPSSILVISADDYLISKAFEGAITRFTRRRISIRS